MYLMLCKSRVPIRKSVMQLWTQKKERPDCGNSRDGPMRNTSDHIVAEERGDVKYDRL